MNFNIIQVKIILKSLYKKYEVYMAGAFFALGFLFDIITLGEIDDLSNIVSQAIYILALTFIITFEYRNITISPYGNKYFTWGFKYRDETFHFILGALLSAFTLFYFKSASLANSFLFMTFLGTLLILNELEAVQRFGIIIRTALFKLCFLSYFICLIPVIIGKVSTLIFLLSLSTSALFTMALFYILNKKDIKNLKKSLIYPHLIILLSFLILYILKVVPPVPLSLKGIGIYHSIEKKNGKYITGSTKPWWRFWDNADENFLYRDGDKIFVFTKIFSPSRYEGEIYVRWLTKIDGEYKTSDRIPLNILGGRREGFRGFTYKENYTEGEWQIRIETENKLEIGRLNLTITKDNDLEERSFKYQDL